MRIVFIPVLCFLFLVSCDNYSKESVDKSGGYENYSKRGYEGQVEDYYWKLVDTTPVLRELEDQIKELANNKDDSTELFDRYNAKNKKFYNSAEELVKRIKDSTLSVQMKELIAKSLYGYNTLTSRHSSILKAIDTGNFRLDDLHTVLKITRTIPIIEKYQKDKLPGTESLKGFLDRLEQINRNIDSIRN